MGKSKDKADNRKLTDRILDLFFPPRCPFCDEAVVSASGLVCDRCLNELHFVQDPFCMKCGKPLREKEAEYCDDCKKNPHVFKANRAVLVYDGRVRPSIYRFKYGGRKEYARCYAGLVAQNLGDWISHIQPDVIVPVPLHRKRLLKRGYNQAALFADRLGRLTGIPVMPSLAVRVKNTRPQKRLDYAGRQKNLKKAFKIRRNDVKLRHVLLVDDIYTTGSTLDALTAVFRQAGAAQVYGLTLSIGCPKGGMEDAGEELQKMRKTV